MGGNACGCQWELWGALKADVKLSLEENTVLKIAACLKLSFTFVLVTRVLLPAGELQKDAKISECSN